MPLDAAAIDELKSNIADARKRELAFGLCLGKSGETTVLVCHKTKDPETLQRQAKKDGETAKVACGTMTVDGKNLNLSCIGDVPPDVARRTREMLKVAGFIFKVRVLDPTGKALQEDGGDEQGGEAPAAAADPLAEEWATAKGRMSERMATARDLADGPGILTDWQQAVGIADGGDLRGALMALEALDRRISAAEEAMRQSEADRQRWEQSRPKLEPLVNEVIGQATPEAGKVRIVWEFIQGKLTAPVPDYAAAVKAIGTLVPLIQAARGGPQGAPVAMGGGNKGTAKGGTGTATATATPPKTPPQQPPQPQQPTAPQGQPQAQQQPPQAQPTAPVDTSKPPAKDAPGTEQLAFAEAKLKELDTAITNYLAIIPGSTETAPAAWTGGRSKVDGVLAPMRGPAGKIDVKRVGDAVKGIELLMGVISGKAAEKTAWKKTLDLVNLRLVPLDRHPERASDPQVAPKIAALKSDLTGAVNKANAQDFKGATSAANGIVTRAETVEKLADDLAHYKSIRAQRQGLTTEAALAHDGVKEVGNLRKAMIKLFDEAEKLSGKEKFPEAIRKLDQMPPVYDQYRRMNELVESYENGDAWLKDAFEKIDLRPAEVLAPFKKKIDGWRKQYANAKFSKTKDYSASVRAFQAVKDIVVTYNPAEPGWFDRELDANAAYVTALKAFEPKLKMFKDHKGRSGIEAFIQGMERDLAQAQAEAKSGKYSTGAALLKRTEGEWDEQKKLADENEAYITKRDEVTKTIGTLKGKKGAEAGVSQAEALMQSAAQQALAKDFNEAKRTVEEAAKRAEDAKAASEAVAELAGLKNNAALSGAAKDLDAAIKVYDDMRSNVAGKDTNRTFAGEIGKADAEAKKAKDEKGKQALNVGAAQQGLAAGIAILEATLPKILAEKPYGTQLTEAKSLATQLTGKNDDNCIQPQITRVNQAITEAERLAASPGLDFAAASAKLVAAREGARKAALDGDLWKSEIKPNRKKVQDAIDKINADAPAAAEMGATLRRLGADITEIDAKKLAEDFKAAAARAKEAAEAATRSDDDLVTVKKVLQQYKDWYSDYTGVGPGLVPGPNPAAAASEIAAMNQLHTQYRAAMDAGNYDAAVGLTNDLGLGVLAVQRLNGEFDTYETARAAAELKLTALRNVRNDDVEEAVKAIEKRYNDAVALSASEKHKPAEKEMLALPADCDKLIEKANDWKAYSDALKTAQDKVGAMETHAQAVAIRPMTNALRGKLAGAVATASKGDRKGAKAILDTIPAEADAALRTADAAGEVTKKAGEVATTPIDPAVLDEAQKLYDKVSNDPNAPAAKADLELADSRLKVAKTTSDPTLARAALKASMEACTRAQVTISQTELVKKAVATLKVELGTLKGHAQAAYISAETGIIETGIKTVEDGLAKSGPDSVGNQIRTLEERCAAAKVLADRHVEYLALRTAPEVEPRLKQLEEHDHRYSVKPQIDAFRKKLDEAATRSAAKDPAGAIKSLEEGRAVAQSAWVMAEMRANNPPSPDDIKSIIEGPGGDAELDAMLQKLEPNAQRDVLKVAFEVRFGTSIDFFSGTDAADNPTGARPEDLRDAANLKKFYDLMIKLPKSHVVDNDSMRKFSVVDGSQSFYSSTNKDVVMREGDAVLSGAYGFGLEHEVGDVDENCKPANDKEVTFFSWNTLHEVGHAVDDKLSYMVRNGASDTHGGWVEHKKDTQTVAEAVAPHFKYDATYIGQFLAKRATPAVPPCPDNCSPEEWEARRVAFEAWAQTTFTGGSPWASNSTAAKIAIGGTVYHESYGNSWSSYKLAARKQGITGYQFRAPGEWFAELYAAYHSEKLKPSHPAVAWLSKL